MSRLLSPFIGLLNRLSYISLQIAAAAEQRTAVAEEIDRNIVSISTLGQQTADGARDTSQASQEVSRLAQSLSKLVSGFKV
ncbi:MAG: hypothetical protein V7629_01900 [Motiliproteus sp.]